MRLIDADALKADIEQFNRPLCDDYHMKAYVLDQIITDIDNQPTVDAVPVVRCKDCKYWYAGENINYCRKFWDDDGEPKLYRCTADDFCSRAERKEE